MRRTAQVVMALALLAGAAALIVDAVSDVPSVSAHELLRTYPETTYTLAAAGIGFVGGMVYWPREIGARWAVVILSVFPVFTLCAFLTHLADGPTYGSLSATYKTLTAVGGMLPAVVCAPAAALGRLVWAPSKRASR